MKYLVHVIILAIIIGFLSFVLFIFAIPCRFALLNPTSDKSIEIFFIITSAIIILLLALEILFMVKGFKNYGIKKFGVLLLIIGILVVIYQVWELVFIIGGIVFNIEYIVKIGSYLLLSFL